MGRGDGRRETGRRRGGRARAAGQRVPQGGRAPRRHRGLGRQGGTHRTGAARMRRLIMWDIDHTLLRGGGVTTMAWQTAFTAVTGVAWRETPNFGGRTDTDVCAEVFATHGVTD